MGKIKKPKKLKQPIVDNSRKAQRKQKRLQKKAHRLEYYEKKKIVKEQPKYSPGRFVKRPLEDLSVEAVVKKKKPKNHPTIQDILSMERDKEIKQTDKLKSQMDERRRDMLIKANEDEDKIIKKLEKQLGLNKSKNKNNYFADDGLDYLLEICDKSTTEQIVAAEKHLAEVDGDSDFDEDLAAVTGKEVAKKDKDMAKKDTKRKEGQYKEFESDDEIDDTENELDDVDSNQEMSENEEFSESADVSDEEENHDDSSDEEMNNFSETSDHSEEPEEKPMKSSKMEKESYTDKTSKKLNKENKIGAEKKNKSKEKLIKADELSKAFSDDEISHISGDDNLDGLSDNEFGEEDDYRKKTEEKPDVWEDIYGRKRDKEGNVIKEEKGVYIPPHLRNKDSTGDKQLAQLKRQIKSVLNKLAGTNLHWACTSIENLYSNNSRNSVNTVLTELWLEATVWPSVTPDRLVAEHAALVSVLHANVGSEIGAHFLQELVKRFDSMMETPQPVEDKRLDNIVACLAQLYTFKIYEAPLLCDILVRLLSSLTEKYIDCSVTALRVCGGTLRRLAARQLQALVQDVQPRAQGLSEAAAGGSRIKFLLEVLMAIKNNNLMKIPNYDPSYQEHLKKMTKTIIRKGNYVTPLNIRLEDLLKADERGKWWVVGSAWEGNTVREGQPAVEDGSSTTYDRKLLELARKQRMNTDVRRSIFCIIMSAEDYLDAFEKLQRLSGNSGGREVSAVILACCLQEATYNPYYGVLAGKLCQADRKYQLSFQFAIWDKIKEIENQSKQCLSNLAQLLTHLIMEKALPLSVLKVIQFSDLNKQTVRFMRQILLSIIMNENLQASLEVFHRISKPPKLHMFRESLRLFIQHFLLKNAGKKSGVLADEEMATLKERAIEVDKTLTMHESKLRF